MRRIAATVLLLAALAGCSNDEPRSEPSASSAVATEAPPVYATAKPAATASVYSLYGDVPELTCLQFAQSVTSDYAIPGGLTAREWSDAILGHFLANDGVAAPATTLGANKFIQDLTMLCLQDDTLSSSARIAASVVYEGDKVAYY